MKRIIFLSASILLFTKLSFPQTENVFIKIDSLLMGENYKAAISELNLLIKDDSANTRAYIKLGQAYQENYQNHKAVSVLQKATDIDTSTTIQLLLAKSYYNLGFNDKAEIIYTSVYRRDSTNKSVAINLARIYQDKLKYKAAFEIYDYLLKQDSVDSYINKQFAFCLMKLDSLDLSLKYYNKSLELNPEDVSSAVQMATICSKLGRQDSAIQFVDYGLLYFPDDPNFNKLKADIFFKKEDYKSAAASYQKAILFGDSSAATYQNLGYSYYFVASESKDSVQNNKQYLEEIFPNYYKAIEAFEKSYKMRNENHLMCYYTALAADKVGDKEKAIFYFNEVIRLTIPNYTAKIYKFLGLDYQSGEKYMEAIDAYKKALFYDPTHKDLLFFIGVIYADLLENDEEAIKYFNAFINEKENATEDLKEFARTRIKSYKK